MLCLGPWRRSLRADPSGRGQLRILRLLRKYPRGVRHSTPMPRAHRCGRGGIANSEIVFAGVRGCVAQLRRGVLARVVNDSPRPDQTNPFSCKHARSQAHATPSQTRTTPVDFEHPAADRPTSINRSCGNQLAGDAQMIGRIPYAGSALRADQLWHVAEHGPAAVEYMP